MTHIATAPLSRRTFLRAAGATLALPFLDAMRPVFGQAAVAAPRRMISICTNLGVLERHFYPTTARRDYALTPYLETLKDFRFIHRRIRDRSACRYRYRYPISFPVNKPTRTLIVAASISALFSTSARAENLALGGSAIGTLSTTGYGGSASRGNDGNRDGNYGGNSVFHSADVDSLPRSSV